MAPHELLRPYIAAFASRFLQMLQYRTAAYAGFATQCWWGGIKGMVLAAFFIFPQACRMVNLSVAQGYRRIVLPTVWPAAIVVTLVAATRHELPVHLYAVLPHMAAAALLYFAIFVAFATEPDDRHMTSAAVTYLRRRRTASLAAA